MTGETTEQPLDARPRTRKGRGLGRQGDTHGIRNVRRTSRQDDDFGGARETRNPGLALFPEILRSDLHSVRSVIEAYSARGKMQGLEEATACGLIVGSNSDALVRVTDASGVLRVYHIDRWD